MKVILHTDGGARGNPGPAGIGAVIDYPGKQLVFKKHIGTATNNQAEYQALILGLEECKKCGATEVEVCMDSELIVEQMKGNYKVKNPELGTLFVKAWNIATGFKKVTFRHVRRADNKLADKLVNEALDQLKG